MYKEFESIAERGGVLGAMETMYQRGKIQEESMLLRDAQARRHAAHRRREHLSQRARGERARAPRRCSAPATRSSARRSMPCTRSRRATRRRRPRRCSGCRRSPPSAAMCSGIARDRAGLLAGADHARAVRSRRPVPPAHVMRNVPVSPPGPARRAAARMAARDRSRSVSAGSSPGAARHRRDRRAIAHFERRPAAAARASPACCAVCRESPPAPPGRPRAPRWRTRRCGIFRGPLRA